MQDISDALPVNQQLDEIDHLERLLGDPLILSNAVNNAQDRKEYVHTSTAPLSPSEASLGALEQP